MKGLGGRVEEVVEKEKHNERDGGMSWGNHEVEKWKMYVCVHMHMCINCVAGWEGP